MIYALLPVHNRLNSTISCIKSILNQKGRKNKIIIIDDGSDGTRDYIERNFPNIVILHGDGYYFKGAINCGVV